MYSKVIINLSGLVLLLLLSACASFKTVSSAELESKNLVGEWHSEQGSRLSIHCSGALSYEMSEYTPFIGQTTSSCTACSVNSIQADRLILGPVTSAKFKVSRWPYNDGGVIKMVAENETWVKESGKSCR